MSRTRAEALVIAKMQTTNALRQYVGQQPRNVHHSDAAVRIVRQNQRDLYAGAIGVLVTLMAVAVGVIVGAS